MKISKITLYLILSYILLHNCESQVSFNTYLVAHLDPHPYVNGNSIGMLGYVYNGREYAIFACNGGTSFIDVTDSSNVHEISFLPGVLSNWRDFKIYSHYCYIVGDVSGCKLQIVDLQYLPDSIHFVTTYSFTGFSRAHTIEQSGPYLFVNGGDYATEGVFVLDLNSNPELPVKRGQWESEYIHDERIFNDTLYACNIYNGSLTVIDATNKDSLRTITSWINGTNPMPHNCAVTSDRKYIFTTDEILYPQVGRLKVWNIQDLNNIQYVTTWWPVGADSSNVHNVEIFGRYAVLSHYTAGVRVLDIGYPPDPVEVAYFDTYPENNGQSWNGCKGIFVLPSGKILANDKQTGFYLIKTTFSMIGVNTESQTVKKFSLKQNYPNPFNPSTTIEFSLPKSTMTTLKLYDILGKEVKTLFNAIAPAGNNKLTFTANNLSSGIYFYRIESGSFIDIKKMVLLK